MAIEIDRPQDERDLDDIRWYLLHRDVSVCIDADGDWYVAFQTPCEALGDDARCSRYEHRPELCREHGEPPGDCEYTGDLFVDTFSTLESLDNWFRMTTFPAIAGDDAM